MTYLAIVMTVSLLRPPFSVVLDGGHGREAFQLAEHLHVLFERLDVRFSFMAVSWRSFKSRFRPCGPLRGYPP